MNRPDPPQLPAAASARDVPLVIKDGLRELRFSTKQGAKRWMEGMETALSQIPKFGAPLGAATKTASHLLQLADRAAVDLLSNESAYRRAEFRLSPPRAYLDAGDEAAVSRLFIKNHYWALKHLLKLKNKPDFLVLETALFHAFQAFQGLSATTAPFQEPAAPVQGRAGRDSLIGARIIHALYDSRPLSHHDCENQAAEDLAEPTATITLHACVSVVLASEIAALVPKPSAPVETLEALKLADEVCGARLERWEAAILHREPVQQLARELDFTIRHL